MRTPRPLLAVALACIAACASPATRDQLALYLENAAQYYDSGHFLRAYQQWEQALEMEPDNEKARLGQAMSLYQMGRAEEKSALGYLAEAETRLDALRREDLGGQEWKAELGYALVQQRWLQLYERKLAKLRDDVRKGDPVDPAEMPKAREEFDRRLAQADSSFREVLAGAEREPTDQLTCWLGLARVAAWRGDLDGAREWAGRYMDTVERSKRLWTDAIKRFPRDAPIYEAKLMGARLQEAELRDLAANMLFKQGRVEDAEKELDKVVELNPKMASAYLNRGILRHERGDWDLARADLRKFLSLANLPDSDVSVAEAERRLAECERKLLEDDAKR